MKSGSAKGAKSKPTSGGWAEVEGEIQEEKIEEENSLPQLPLTGI
jgi:hypothetical protein